MYLLNLRLVNAKITQRIYCLMPFQFLKIRQLLETLLTLGDLNSFKLKQSNLRRCNVMFVNVVISTIQEIVPTISIFVLKTRTQLKGPPDIIKDEY